MLILMNKDLLRYKSQFITIILLVSYAFLHINLTGRYVDATFEQLLDFSARLPFGQRLLVPAIARGLGFVLPLAPNELFFLTELMALGLFYIVLIKLLRVEFNSRQSQLLAWLFILLLPLVTVVNYRFSLMGEATIYYPYDGASLFFMTAGFLLCLQQRWMYFIPLVFLATFNRESSFILVFLIPALHWQKLRMVIWPFIGSLLAYLFAKVIILLIVHNLPGEMYELYYRATGHTHFEVNLAWLFTEQHLLLFVFCLAGLPLFWFCFYDYIPVQYRPIRYVALAYFLGLLLVGNFMEARIFIEIVALLYFPVCVAITRWLNELVPYSSVRDVTYFIDRYFVIGALILVILLQTAINPLVIWFANQF